MTETPKTTPQIVMEVTRDGWTKGLQLSISAESDGYRIAGPKFNGSQFLLLSAELDERDAREIREYLDRGFPQAAPALTVFRAGFQGHDIPLGTYTNREAARAHCEAFARREGLTADLNWVLDEPDDESSVEELVAGGEPTGYIVTPVEVASAFDEEADE